MATVPVTITSNAANIHYGIFPTPVIDLTGNGVESDTSHWGYINPWQDNTGDGETTTQTVNLNPILTYTVAMDIEGSPSIIFSGFQPGTGGDIFEMLTAQGWTQ